jgi:hypothetical protein
VGAATTDPLVEHAVEQVNTDLLLLHTCARALTWISTQESKRQVFERDRGQTAAARERRGLLGASGSARPTGRRCCGAGAVRDAVAWASFARWRDRCSWRRLVLGTAKEARGWEGRDERLQIAQVVVRDRLRREAGHPLRSTIAHSLGDAVVPRVAAEGPDWDVAAATPSSAEHRCPALRVATRRQIGHS